MIRFQLLYGLTLVGLFLFVILYLDPMAMLLFLMIMILPILLFILHQLTASFLTITLESPTSIVTSQADYYFYFTVKNRSYFPVPLCIATVEIYNQLLGTSEQKTYRFSIGSHGTTRATVSYTMPICGAYELRLKEVRAYSFLSLFKKRCFPKARIESIRLPEIQTVSPPSFSSDLPEEVGDSYSKNKAGDDVSEIFALREWRDGDSLQRIHWKLSSKLSTFIVKEYSLPSGSDITIVFDVVKEKTQDFPKRLEDVLSLTLSLCLSFVEKGTSCTMIWYDKNLMQQQQSKIDSEEQCYRTFYALLRAPLLSDSIKELPLEVLEHPYIRIVASPSASFILENTYES